ncbi:MAG: hypothetical protein JWP41_233 [Ramlibacter sp.]|jgi:hypothetical protein|nr:hypothetical protein [Ramlibacter sp.]
MATAFLPLGNLFASINAMLAWFAPRPAPVPCAAVRVAPQRPALRQAAIKPLRVVRVLEPTTSRSAAGRMVISGRLADVCAELDRLAAQEARSQ